MAETHTNEYFINGLLKGKDSVIKEIYTEFLPKVIAYVCKNQGDEDAARDVFQKALLQLSGRIKVREFELSHSFGAYLFTACKNLWLRELKKKQLRGVTSEKVKGLYYKEEDLAQSTLDQERWELFQETFQLLSDNCRQLLTLLFEKVSGREIMAQLNYGSESTVRQRIFKCKTRLTQLMMKDARFSSLQYK